MAITKVAQFASSPASTTDYQAQNAHINAFIQQMSGVVLHLTEWGTTTVPQIAQGVYLRHAGVLYIVDTADFTIATGDLSGAGTYYIRIKDDGGEIDDIDWESSLSGYSWNTTYQGLYDSSGHQLLPYVVSYDGSSSYAKYRILNIDSSVTTVTATGSYTVPNYFRLIAIAIGGGGGGGGGTCRLTTKARGGGGGGAGYVSVSEITPRPGSLLSITIGAGGAGGAGGGGGESVVGDSGGDGTLSKVVDAAGETLLTANGGDGGDSGYYAVDALGGSGYYAGGDGSDGDDPTEGGDGECASNDGYTYQHHGGNNIDIKRGAGGGGGGKDDSGATIGDPGSGFDGGGDGGAWSENGEDASTYGSGGGGGGGVLTADGVDGGDGGDGGDGVVYIIAL